MLVRSGAWLPRQGLCSRFIASHVHRVSSYREITMIGIQRAAFSLIVSVLTIITSLGCGYTFQGSGSILPEDVKQLYIPTVINNSTESSLTQQLTDALQDQFERYGAVQVLDTNVGADAVLEVRIMQVRQGTRTSTAATDTALTLDTELTLFAELRRITGQVLWRNPSLIVSTAFGTSRSAVVTSTAGFATGTLGSSDLAGLNERELARGQEQEALAQLCEQAAMNIYDSSVAPDF